MKRLTHENGQPRLVKENLDWETGAMQTGFREHITDIFTEGFILNSGLDGINPPCVIKVNFTNRCVNVTSGVAIAPLVAEWPVANIDSLDPTETGGERIVISEADAAVKWDPANVTHTTNNGLGVMVSTPKSSGAFGIPVNYSSTPMYTYLWLAYLDAVSTDAVSTAPGDTVASKTEPGKILFPKHTSGYQIQKTATNVPPNNDRKWLLIGSVYVPADPDEGLTGRVIDQSGQKFSDVRSNSSMESLIAYQNDSHQGGIISSSGNALAPSRDNAFVINPYSSAARCVQLSAGEAIYVDGYRGTSITPTYSSLGVEYGYVGFNLVDCPDFGVYSIFIDRNPATKKFFVNKVYGTVVPSGKVLVGTVSWNGDEIGADVADLRKFGLTGTSNIKNASVTNEKIAGGIVPEKILLAYGKMILGNDTNTGEERSISGDLTVDASGVATIANGVVTVDKLAVGSVVPTKIDDTKTYTVNALVSKTGITINTGTIRIPQGASANKYLVCSEDGTGVWQTLPNIPGQTPAPIRWAATGEMATANGVVQSLIEGSMTITEVRFNLATPPTDNTVQLDITKNGQTIFSGLVPSYTTGQSGPRVVNSGFNANAVLAAGDILGLNITVTSDGGVITGTNLLATISFATIV